MTKVASFEVDVTPQDAIAFATLSGDWNPLHTNAEHAARTAHRRPVLHGAFSAGLLSRMAGMYLPGADCLLHGMKLRFIRPIVPPVSLRVVGKVVADDGRIGRVEVTISDHTTGLRYVEGTYDFGRHEIEDARDARVQEATHASESTERIIVTGASGGLGAAVLERLGRSAVGTTRGNIEGLLEVPDLAQLGDRLGPGKVSAIVHCAWPATDNQALLSLPDVDAAVEYNLASPLRQMIVLAKLLNERGSDNAILILIGSSFASPGRHSYRMPLYTLSKSLIPVLNRILAVELATRGGRRCVALTFDVVEGGMNKGISPASRAMHADRVPSGRLPTPEEVAGQVAWVMENRSSLLSGATIDLTGAAIP